MAKDRSPNYPSLNLEEAVGRVELIYRAEHTHTVAQIAVFSDLGYNGPNGRALTTLGALRAYKLLEGRGDAIKVSSKAVTIIEFASEPSHQGRLQSLRDCALAPPVFSEMFQQFGERLPSDATMRHWLISKDFLSNAADEVIRTFRENLDYLQRSNVGYNVIEDDSTDMERPPTIKVGDHVQWESQGVLQFVSPRQVTGFSDDGEWAFVEGSNTGVPMSELTIADAPAHVTDKTAYQLGEKLKNVLKQAPANPHFALAPPPANTRQDVFSIGEGTITVQWPASLSPESFEDVSAWMDILKRKIGRSVPYKATKRDVISKLKSGSIIDGDPDSETPCGLIDPSQTTTDSVLLIPAEMLRELLEDGILNENSGTGRRRFSMA